MNNDSEARDQLALTRTQLANERTFLAYIRTGLSFLAAAALLVHFSDTLDAYLPLAWLSAGLGLLILVVGLFRFAKAKKHLSANG